MTQPVNGPMKSTVCIRQCLFSSRRNQRTNSQSAEPFQRKAVKMVILNDSNHTMGYYIQQRPWTPTKRRGPIAAEYTSPGPASVALPSTVAGASKFDCTRSRSPAFTFGGRHEEKINYITPGPGSYTVEGVSRTGKDTAPAPTLSGRNKEPELFQTPAPGAYTIQGLSRTGKDNAPAPTISGRNKEPEQFCTPAPGTYNIEGLSRMGKETVPAPTMAGRNKDPEPFQTPAPGSYNIDGLCRTGRDCAPAPTISGRNKEPEPFQTPAPGTYNIDGLCRTGKDFAPAPTISGRNKEPEPFQTPAPGAYNIDGLCRTGRDNAPAPTMAGRNKDPEPFQTPAPGTYNIDGLSRTGKESFLAPTISGRNKEPEPFLTPAPGAYSPEKSMNVFNTSPRYSFGLKGKDAKNDITPAPNSYNIPSLLGGTKDSIHPQSPSFTISGKANGLWDERKDMPGPGTYSVPSTEKYKSKSPSYSLSTRTNIPTDPTKKPGPGAHSPEKTKLKHGPAYSFGIRHSPHASNADHVVEQQMQFIQQCSP